MYLSTLFSDIGIEVKLLLQKNTFLNEKKKNLLSQKSVSKYDTKVFFSFNYFWTLLCCMPTLFFTSRDTTLMPLEFKIFIFHKLAITGSRYP